MATFDEITFPADRVTKRMALIAKLIDDANAIVTAAEKVELNSVELKKVKGTLEAQLKAARGLADKLQKLNDRLSPVSKTTRSISL